MILKKSYPKLLNLYFFGVSIILIYIVLFLMAIFHLFSHFSFNGFHNLIDPLMASLKIVIFSIAVSLSFASAICLFVLINSRSSYIRGMHNFLLFIDRSPLVLFGVSFFIIFGEKNLSLYLIGSLISCSKISRRWIQQSKKISSLEFETAQSLGMDFSRVMGILYIKRFLIFYLGHIFSVAGFLLTAVAPFVYFLPFREDILNLFGLSFFLQLGGGSEQLSLMVLILLIVYFFKFLFDSKTGFIEVEHG